MATTKTTPSFSIILQSETVHKMKGIDQKLHWAQLAKSVGASFTNGSLFGKAWFKFSSKAEMEKHLGDLKSQYAVKCAAYPYKPL